MHEWTDENDAEVVKRVEDQIRKARKEAETGAFKCHSCDGTFARDLVSMTDWGWTCETCNDDINKIPSGS